MKNITCIVCPRGCKLIVKKVNNEYEVKGNGCRRGIKYGIEESTSPKRIITTTVKLENSYLSLLPVKTSDYIPKGIMLDIMKELKDITVSSPINIGDIIIENILDTGVNIVSTKTV